MGPALAALLLLPLAARARADDTGSSELQKCRICHTLDKGGANRVGPNLFSIFGRKAGTGAGYNYSPAMKDSGIVWDDRSMAGFLRDPRGAIPGNHMSFPGIQDDAALDDLLAQLKRATQ
jgi:cytochrome c